MVSSTGQNMWDVVRVFGRLGLTSFGGPIAHIGYFQAEFVERRKWLSAERFTQLLAICQLLPGPASSQLGFAIGRERAGYTGAWLAFAAFTAPSVVLLFALAQSLYLLDGAWGSAAVHGLKLVAVVVVTLALYRMARQSAPDWTRAAIAVVACVVLLSVGSASAQLVVIVVGGVIGWRYCDSPPLPPSASSAPFSRVGVAVSGVGFALLLTIAVAYGRGSGLPALPEVAAAFYRAGALVFGGGHVVLPLLEESIVATGWMSADVFLTGYGAAQAVPGPLFSLAAFLGAGIAPYADARLVTALVAVIAVFLPGFLLVSAVVPIWDRARAVPGAGGAIFGVNAAVVGVLAATLITPVASSAIRSVWDGVIVLGGLAIGASPRRSAIWIVLWGVCVSLALHALGMQGS